MTKASLIFWLLIDLVLNTASVLLDGTGKYVVTAIIFLVIARQAFRLFIYHAEVCSQREVWERDTERLIRQNSAAWEKEMYVRLKRQRKQLIRSFANLENRLGRRFR